VHFVPGYDTNGSLLLKVTRLNSDDSIDEITRYEYNLQNRLASVYIDDNTTKTPSNTSDDTLVTEYFYNNSGVRVKKIDYSSSETTTYLIDSYNHTGYAQVFEETVFSGTDIDPANDDPSSRMQYTIGDDVISQTYSTYSSGWTADDTQYLLYDGHGSTRQLIEHPLVSGEVVIAEDYDYDGFELEYGF